MMEENLKTINFGVCVNSEPDPALAGRIRGVFDKNYKTESPTDYDYNECQKISQEHPNKYKTPEEVYWSEDDPHIISPFLPYYVNVVPKKDENIKIIVYDRSNETQNKEYIGPTISAPNKLEYEHYGPGRQDTSKGTRQKRKALITDSDKSQNTFAYPNQVSIDGRDNSDLVFSSGEVVLRAGKFIPNDKIPEYPLRNPQVTQLQVSNFPQTLNLTKVVRELDVVKDVEIKWLVEYDVYVPQPITQTSDINTILFNGNVILYELTIPAPPLFGPLPTTDDIGPISEIQATSTGRGRLDFNGVPISGVTYLINNFLEEIALVDEKSLASPPYNVGATQSGSTGSWEKKSEYIEDLGSQANQQNQTLNFFPFYFRPTISLSSLLGNQTDDTSLTKKWVNEIINKIRIPGIAGDKYFGYCISKDQPELEVGKSTFNDDIEDYDESKRQGVINAISNKITLYSYDSSIPNKTKTNPTITNENDISVGDNMGLDQKTLLTVDSTETEPLVRGDQFLILIEKIVNFLQSHVHGEPNTTAYENQTLIDIQKMLKDKDFLNENIRIN